jgi:putative Ca2+/H+ antiporter (TMEM165/GDT1 family)
VESFLTTFGLVLLLELGDKTQLLVLSLTTRTGRPVPVFAGAALALIAATALAAAFGSVLLRFIPEVWLSRLAGVVFIGVGLLLLRATLRGQKDGAGRAIKMPEGTSRPGALRLTASTFGLLFLAEMGDKSQISVVTLVAETGDPAAVFLGAALALSSLTLAAALAGQALARLIPAGWLHRASAVLFIVLGALTLARAG